MIDLKIIKIASNTKYAGLKNIYTHKSNVKNSLCGDKIKIEIVTRNEKISSMRYETDSCILCEASASLLSNKVKSYSIKDLLIDMNILKEMIKIKNLNFPLKFKEFKFLLNTSNIYRKNCVILPIDALLKAFK